LPRYLYPDFGLSGGQRMGGEDGPRAALMRRFEACFQDSPQRPLAPARSVATSMVASQEPQKRRAGRDALSLPEALQNELAQGLDEARRCIADINVLRHHSDIEIEKSLASLQGGRQTQSTGGLGLVLQVLFVATLSCTLHYEMS